MLGADGANCTFTNKGQEAGARCFKVRRLEDGFPELRAAGLPVVAGSG